MVRLPAVHAGAEIGIVAPASFARQDRTEAGIERLRGIGFTPHLMQNVQARGPLFFSGTREERLADLHAAYANESVQAIMCLRGGYGSNYLLDGLDLDLIHTHAKPFFGYSDLTAYQLHLLDRFSIPAFHGPMLAADVYLENGVHLPSFHAAIAGQTYNVGAAEGLRALKPGKASGVLYGGCLSILVEMLGTPWEPQTEGKLLFIEDVAERPYKINRMLWQLRAAGKLKGVTGIVFGEMLDCATQTEDAALLEAAILHALDGFEGPIAIGLRSGHVSRQNVTLTLGVQAEVQVGEETELKLLETAVKA